MTPGRDGILNRFTKLLTGAAAGVGLLALMFSGKGSSSDKAEERADAEAGSADHDQVSTVIGPSEREGSEAMRKELDGTDLFVG